MKHFLLRGMTGGLLGGSLGFGYHTFVVNNAKVCHSCDQSAAPIVMGTLIGVGLALFGRS